MSRKLNIKNDQIAKAINLGGIKDALGKTKSKLEQKPAELKPETTPELKQDHLVLSESDDGSDDHQPKAKKVRAKTRSAFDAPEESSHGNEPAHDANDDRTDEPLAHSIPPEPIVAVASVSSEPEPPEPIILAKAPIPVLEPTAKADPTPSPPAVPAAPRVRLGPTGRHVRDILPPTSPPQASQSNARPDRRKEHLRDPNPRDPNSRGPRQGGGYQGGYQGNRPRTDGQDGRPPKPYQSHQPYQAREGGRPGDSRVGDSRGPRPPYRQGPGNNAGSNPGNNPGGGAPYRPRTDGGGFGQRPFQRPQGPRPYNGPRGPGGGPGSGFRPNPADVPLPPSDRERNFGPNRESFKERDDKKAAPKAREFRDTKPKRVDLRSVGQEGDEYIHRKKRRAHSFEKAPEEIIIRPKEVLIRLPISIKDLSSEMKLKSGQLIAKLFMQGITMTVNELIDDETTVQLLGQEFDCNVRIDTAKEDRMRVTKHTIRQEVASGDPSKLVVRAPVVAFMGHVDHGKTSLIDAIRKSNLAGAEKGKITQHIGAFSAKTPRGELTILDTPGHEAFSAMRERGADITDVVVLVVAGDEGVKEQTVEAIKHAQAANVCIIVAVNKCDKEGFDLDRVHRELSEHNLLPEVWGGTVITVPCSAKTGEGLDSLLEMILLQSDVLELRSDPSARARGTVVESEMHKGMGAVATVLVQNGTLRVNDAIVFDEHYGRIKTLRNEHGESVLEAAPGKAVEVTGLSGLPQAGSSFIIVPSEKEAKEVAEMRMESLRTTRYFQRSGTSMESLLAQTKKIEKKTLNVLIRADTQGSLEALKHSLNNIESEKIDLNIIFSAPGEITESDMELAANSDALIVGFHTKVEAHAESLQRELNVTVRLFDIIYHAIDDIKEQMRKKLDKIAEEVAGGVALVRATFRSSALGTIAGCIVDNGEITRKQSARLIRDGQVIWKGPIASLKREKNDAAKVAKGLECGILLGTSDIKVDDRIETYEIIYKEQTL